MEGTDMESVVVYDDRVIWHFAPGTKIRELGNTGREFIVDKKMPGKLWLGSTPCQVSDLEMPVEVIGRGC
ncbi:hypothetical protein [Rhodococcus sp. IEGM 1379]|uniref:hypothetical protein n=1 Tax=Rhodococcus sp. IEGM 1379 TaxID=3047086 RepID=UPI0024B7D440|nr:hypothetical protein [Rhodococcus sp. IEGM 1379]MDI9914399.1 hypothetical protein [Rhodococcus sp. IEGM 1379]